MESHHDEAGYEPARVLNLPAFGNQENGANGGLRSRGLLHGKQALSLTELHLREKIYLLRRAKVAVSQRKIIIRIKDAA